MATTTKIKCWCGCGKYVTASKSNFIPGHDVYAALAIAKLHYGSIQNMVKKYGYGPSLQEYSLQVSYEQMKEEEYQRKLERAEERKYANHKRTRINSHGSRRRSFQRARRQNSNVG